MAWHGLEYYNALRCPWLWRLETRCCLLQQLLESSQFLSIGASHYTHYLLATTTVLPSLSLVTVLSLAFTRTDLTILPDPIQTLLFHEKF